MEDANANANANAMYNNSHSVNVNNNNSNSNSSGSSNLIASNMTTTSLLDETNYETFAAAAAAYTTPTDEATAGVKLKYFHCDYYLAINVSE